MWQLGSGYVLAVLEIPSKDGHIELLAHWVLEASICLMGSICSLNLEVSPYYDRGRRLQHGQPSHHGQQSTQTLPAQMHSCMLSSSERFCRILWTSGGGFRPSCCALFHLSSLVSPRHGPNLLVRSKLFRIWPTSCGSSSCELEGCADKPLLGAGLKVLRVSSFRAVWSPAWGFLLCRN